LQEVAAVDRALSLTSPACRLNTLAAGVAGSIQALAAFLVADGVEAAEAVKVEICQQAPDFLVS
jgi:hypothetical protein